MLPESPGESSRTYNDQMPFGLEALKAPRTVGYGPAGAGTGNGATSAKSEVLFVPETIGPLRGTVAAAASSNVSVRLLTPVPPPALAMSSVSCPLGPTRRISKSFGNWWLKLFKVTVTLLRAPLTPATLIDEGYGWPGPLSGMTMPVELANVLV